MLGFLASTQPKARGDRTESYNVLDRCPHFTACDRYPDHPSAYMCSAGFLGINPSYGEKR
ncbi:hypothetical protein [Adonisia turfae]|uniref:hypothetical protein n=1 Tax=Adonisia turfae TaxID=2950184 RepID=UPI0013D2B598|nr:hypothetical protein [Adonisia turfae]